MMLCWLVATGRKLQAVWQAHLARYPQPVWVKKAFWVFSIKKLALIIFCLCVFYWGLNQDQHFSNTADFPTTLLGLGLLGPYAIDFALWPVTLSYWLVQCHCGMRVAVLITHYGCTGSFLL